MKLNIFKFADNFKFSMTMIKRISGFGLSMVAVLILFSSCVNEDYDLEKGIVAEGTLFENISAPIGNVEKITIENLLFADEGTSSAVQADADGNLYIDFAGGNASADVEVPSLSLGRIELEDQVIAFDIPAEFRQLVNSGFINTDWTLAYSTLIGNEKGLELQTPIEISSVLPDGIKKISEVYLDASLSCDFSVNAGVMHVSEGFSISFPSFINVSKKGNSADFEVLDSHVVKFVKDAVLSADSPLSLELSFDRISVSDSNIANGKISFTDEIKIEGDFYVSSKDLDFIPENIKIVMGVAFDEIKVTEVLASLNYTTNLPDEDITIGELPELLSGKGVCVDLYNPVLSLALENGSPFGFSLDADVTAYSASGSQELHIGSNGVANSNYIYIPAESSKEFMFSRRELASVPQGSANIVIPALGNLIKQVPERLRIHDLNVELEDKMTTVKVGSRFNVGVDYGMSSQLAFGEDLYLSVVQDIKDLNLSLDVNIRSAELSMEIVNSIPVDFALEAVCLDAAGNVLNGTNVSIDKTIAAGSHTSPTSTPAVLRIENNADQLNVASLRLTLTATSENPAFHGVCLNKNQGLEIKNMVLTLPDGIGVELK